MNSAHTPQIMMAFAAAMWDAMAPAERMAVIQDADLASMQADVEEIASMRFREMHRVDQYGAAGRILLGPLEQFKGIGP